MIVTVIVGVATNRPPAVHRMSKVKVVVDDALPDLSDLGQRESEAIILAMHMASGHNNVVMPVSYEIEEIEL